MAKTFYTERDIEDLFAIGQTSLQLNDDVVITDLGRERANQIGFKLLQEHDKPSSAPERPYLAKQPHKSKPKVATFSPPITKLAIAPQPVVTQSAAPISAQPALSINLDPLERKIFDAVISKLDGSVNPNMLAAIIKRILQNVGGN